MQIQSLQNVRLAFNLRIMVKYIFFSIIALVLVLSCKKEDDSTKYDFSISGIEKITVNVEETKTLRLLITKNEGVPENVYLTLGDVPQGITLRIDHVSGEPDFATDLDITVAKNAVGGEHKIILIAHSGDLVKEYTLEITVDKSLSATFSVFNATTYNPENASSNLLDSALIKLYKSDSTFLIGKPDFSEYTNASGKANFYKLIPGKYLFTIEKGSLNNIVQKRNVDGVIKGYVAAGMFRTSAEIINSAQPKAKVGDLKFRDLNADNKIDENDLARNDNLSIYDGEVNEKVIWLGE